MKLLLTNIALLDHSVSCHVTSPPPRPVLFLSPLPPFAQNMFPQLYAFKKKVRDTVIQATIEVDVEQGCLSFSLIFAMFCNVLIITGCNAKN